MAKTAEAGVCDENAQMFGINNLFVSGSALFSTYGCANPTFTIVALAWRLADYLTQQNPIKS